MRQRTASLTSSLEKTASIREGSSWEANVRLIKRPYAAGGAEVEAISTRYEVSEDGLRAHHTSMRRLWLRREDQLGAPSGGRVRLR